MGLPAGNYYIIVDPDNFNSSTYGFTVNYVPSNVWETEVNNGYAEADEIGLGTSYYGANQMSGDVDYYRFSLGSPSTVKISFIHNNLNDNNTYWYMSLYNAQANEVEEITSKGTETTAYSDVISLPAGSYYIKISTYHHSTSTYGLMVSYCQPIAIPGLNASVSGDSVILNWNAVNDVHGYYIYRSTSPDGYYSQIKQIDNRTTTSYVDTSVSAGSTYYYKICTYRDVSNERRYGEDSSVVGVRTAPAKVNSCSVQAGKKKATISWSAVDGSSGYEIYMSTKKSKGYKKIKTIKKSSKIKFVKKKLKRKKNYYFKVRAYTNVGGQKIYGTYSEPQKVRVR